MGAVIAKDAAHHKKKEMEKGDAKPNEFSKGDSKKEIEAAVKIQAVHRGRLARQETGKAKEERAATKIQSVYRGNQTRASTAARKRRGSLKPKEANYALSPAARKMRKERQAMINDFVEMKDHLSTVKYRVGRSDVDDLVSRTQFTRVQLEDLCKQFKKATDSSATGHMHLSHFTDLMLKYFPENDAPLREDLQKLFKDFDLNGDGQMDFIELAIGMNASLNGTMEEKLKQCWAIYDRDDDGYISLDEITGLLEKKKQEQKDCIELLTTVFDSMDVNHDHKLSYEEYHQAILDDPILMQCYGRVLPSYPKLCNDDVVDALEQTRDKAMFDYNEIRRVWKMHSINKTDSKSVVNKDGFHNTLNTLFNLSDRSITDRAYGVFDANADGEVDFREFVLGLRPLLGTQEEKLQFFFSLYDHDGDEYIDKTELYRALNVNLGSVDEMMEAAKTVLGQCDTDHDGKINFTEFEEAIKMEPALAEIFGDVLK